MVRVWTLLAILALGAAVTASSPAEIGPQQLVFQSMASLSDGTRVGIFLPNVAIALGLQSKRGPKILTIGDVLRCKPFDEEVEMFRKTPAGEYESFNGHQQLLNCGPMIAGGPDRILMMVGIQWRQ